MILDDFHPAQKSPPTIPSRTRQGVNKTRFGVCIAHLIRNGSSALQPDGVQPCAAIPIVRLGPTARRTRWAKTAYCFALTPCTPYEFCDNVTSEILIILIEDLSPWSTGKEPLPSRDDKCRTTTVPHLPQLPRPCLLHLADLPTRRQPPRLRLHLTIPEANF